MLYSIIVLFAAAFGMSATLFTKPNCSFGELVAGAVLTGAGALFSVVYILKLTGGAA